jgi:hypothetical protein
LRISISKKLIPADLSGTKAEGLRNFTQYVKYIPEDLENQILTFFAGSINLYSSRENQC